jgi:hypothetical protein
VQFDVICDTTTLADGRKLFNVVPPLTTWGCVPLRRAGRKVGQLLIGDMPSKIDESDGAAVVGPKSQALCDHEWREGKKEADPSSLPRMAEKKSRRTGECAGGGPRYDQ